MDISLRANGITKGTVEKIRSTINKTNADAKINFAWNWLVSE
jgi:hypothetical protein